MLMMIGAVQFKVAPFNVAEYSHDHSASHVEKPIMGSRPALEWTGDGPESWTLRATIHPGRFGGEGALVLLALMRKSGTPQYMLRGDGSLMGWVVIDSVSERSSYLDASGVGKVIEVDISMRRSDAPAVGGYFASMKNLLSGLF